MTSGFKAATAAASVGLAAPPSLPVPAARLPNIACRGIEVDGLSIVPARQPLQGRSRRISR